MPQIIKIEIFVLLLCLIFADRHGAICFRISTAVSELWALEGNYFSTREAEKMTSFPYTNPPGFSEKHNRPNMWQMLKKVMMLLLVTPYHVVEARWSLHALAPQHQLSCRSSVPLLWQPHPFHVSFSRNSWAHEAEIASACEGGSLEHIYVESAKYKFQTVFVLFCKTLVCSIWVVYAYTVTIC